MNQENGLGSCLPCSTKEARYTHHICATTGICCGPVGLFLTPNSIPDEEREGTSQFLVWLSYAALTTQ